MKNLLFTIIIIHNTCYIACCQINIGFEPGYSYGYTLHPDSDSTWQVAMPSKGRFTSAHSGDFALLTDSVNYFQPSRTSLMEICFQNNGCFNMSLSFYHKYYTDSLHSGGKVEVSYDGGSSWTNIIYDTLGMDMYYYNFYSPSDTITGGDPVYTGSVDLWKESSLSVSRHGLCGQPYSVRYRFIFKADSSALPLEGWMIDDISLYVMPCKINTVRNEEKPCFTLSDNGNSTYFVTVDQDCLINICSMAGNTVFVRNGKKNEKLTIETGKWKPGYYIVSAISNSSSCSKKIRIF